MLPFSFYNPVFYLNTFSNFSFLFQESLCLRCLRKICHHVPSTLTVGKRYIGPWRHYCADQSLPSFASTHYFCFFFFNSSGSYFNGFFVSGSASYCCEKSQRYFLSSSTECSLLKWNLQSGREWRISQPSLTGLFYQDVHCIVPCLWKLQGNSLWWLKDQQRRNLA